MLYSEIIAVCSEIHTKHINTLCGQNVELLNVKLVVHIVTTVRYIYIYIYPLQIPPTICTANSANNMHHKIPPTICTTKFRQPYAPQIPPTICAANSANDMYRKYTSTNGESKQHFTMQQWTQVQQWILTYLFSLQAVACCQNCLYVQRLNPNEVRYALSHVTAL
jgi:hypothetical protein